MPDLYGVTPTDIASELRGLYPVGFSETTIPTEAQVETWITTADTVASMRVADVSGQTPAATDKASVLARRFIIEWVKEQVIRTAYAGNDLERVERAAAPFRTSAKMLLADLEMLGAQSVGTGEASPRVRVFSDLPNRDLMITDDMLDIGSHRTKSF